MTLLLAALLLLAPRAPQADSTRLGWVPNPRRATAGWVSDPAHHLKPATVAAIDSTISELERATTAEIAVVVIDSLDGLEPDVAAFQLHRRWGVGKANRDNGIVLLWSPTLRKIHVSVGYGLEGVLPDARAGRIQDDAMLAAFRRGDFDGGVLAGVQALAAAAREETYSGMARSATARPPAGESATGTQLHWLSGLFTAVLAIPLAIIAGFKIRRYRPRRCPKGHGWMRRLSESDDDAHLLREDLLEERLKSVDYDVWLCPTCGETLVLSYSRFMSRFEKCPQCRRRTLEVKKTITKKPTYTSSGIQLVNRRCKNCSFADEKEKTIPKLVASSGGSSSGGGGGGGGGGSFGGGSSGGGGAGRSY